MSLFSLFKSSEKAMDTVTHVAKGGMEMFDEAFYTDQEKAAVNDKIFKNWLKGQELFNMQSSPTARSRRVIVWGVTFLVAYGVILSTMLIAFKGNNAMGQVMSIMDVYDAMKIGWAFVAAIGFYFGPHIVHAIGSKNAK